MPTTREGRPPGYGQPPQARYRSSARAPRTPRENLRRVLLPGRCECGNRVEFVAGCGWVLADGWEPCDHR